MCYNKFTFIVVPVVYRGGGHVPRAPRFGGAKWKKKHMPQIIFVQGWGLGVGEEGVLRQKNETIKQKMMMARTNIQFSLFFDPRMS